MHVSKNVSVKVYKPVLWFIFANYRSEATTLTHPDGAQHQRLFVQEE